MQFPILFLAACHLLLATLNPPILEITDAYDSNINQLISSGGEAYLMFHASWCGACQRFKPYYQAFADDMSDISPSVQVFSIDNDQNPKLVARFQIAYLPTLYHVREGKVRNISDHRADLLEYVKHQKWNEIKPVSGYFTPYSMLGNVLAVVGTIGYSILAVVDMIHARTKIPQHMVLCVMMALFFIVFYSFLFNFVLPKQKPLARRPSRPVEQHVKSE